MDAGLRRQLLSCFSPQVGWAERECVQQAWLTLRGEAPVESKALPGPPPVKLTGSDNGAATSAAGFAGVGRIFGLHNFETGGLLGDGNYSQVLEATVRPTQERVAFKIVDKQKMSRHKKGDEVLVEKHVLSTAQHPTIIKLFHTFQDAGALYMALELVPGGELWAICHRRGVHPCHAAYWTGQVAEALQHLHENGIVHRDVKPENALLTREGRVKLIDFGSAKLMEAVEMDAPLRLRLGLRDPFKAFVGTPDYMAPEAINNKPTDFRSDLWSLGCFACMLLAGQPPFHGGSDYLTFKRVQARLFHMPEGIPPDAADLIDNLLVMDPTSRLGGRVDISAPPAGRHAALLAHPFFDRATGAGAGASSDFGGGSKGDGGGGGGGCPVGGGSEDVGGGGKGGGDGGDTTARQPPLATVPPRRPLYKLHPPVPPLFELCVEPVCTQLTRDKWYRGGHSPGLPAAGWPAEARRAAIFELKRKGALNEELRGVLGAGAAPAEIDEKALLNEAPAGEAKEETEETLLTEEEDEHRRQTRARWAGNGGEGGSEGGGGGVDGSGGGGNIGGGGKGGHMSGSSDRTRPHGTRDVSQALPAELAEMEEEDQARAAEAEAMFGVGVEAVVEAMKSGEEDGTLV